jgi:hypothetical protein
LGLVSSDESSLRYSDLLTGIYDCVDRIVLNAFFPLGHNAGGFRVWWRRWHDDSDAELDNTHLMRLAGRFARRVKAWGSANGVPVIFSEAGERKHRIASHRIASHRIASHRIAEEYLATHEVETGVFLVLAAKAPAPVWKVKRSAAGRNVNIERRSVNTSTTIRFTSWIRRRQSRASRPGRRHTGPGSTVPRRRVAVVLGGQPQQAQQRIGSIHEDKLRPTGSSCLCRRRSGHDATRTAAGKVRHRVLDTSRSPSRAHLLHDHGLRVDRSEPGAAGL